MRDCARASSAFSDSTQLQAVATIANTVFAGYFAGYFAKLSCYVYGPFGRCTTGAGLLP